MSLRRLFQVPKYTLFYFDLDKTTSTLPMNNIKKVMSGDYTSKGSKVVVLYGNEQLKATILGVAGKKTFTMYGLFLGLLWLYYKPRNCGDFIGLQYHNFCVIVV